MKTKTLTVLLIAGLAIPATLLAQTTQSAARQASQRAQQLLASSDWREAARVSSEALSECEPGEPGRACRLLLYYTLGYVHQVQSRRSPGDATKLLQDAARYYEQVLDEQPDHGPSLKNLALIYTSLDGDEGSQNAEAFLKSALVRDTLNSSTYALLLGDRYRSEGAWEAALEAYQRAALENPEDESARLRWVEIYRHLPAGESEKLFERLPEWESRFPEAARRGYEIVIEQAHESNVDLAESALLEWVDLLARRRSIDLESLSALPAQWRSEAVAGLRRYLQRPYREPESSNWWMRTREGRSTLAVVGLALGIQKVAAGEVKRAEECWNTGISFAPIDGVAVLDLRAELASLYYRYPELDPDGEKFSRIEHELFKGKGAAYSEDDLDAIQQYHTVLAITYAEKGVWTSSRFARNAIFQIEHAIGTAIQRDALNGTHQPLPYLKSKLAEGYAATDNVSGARRMYVEAAGAYLDSDDPAEARRNLVLASEFGEREERVNAMSALIDLRARLERARDERSDAEILCGDPDRLATTLESAANAGLGPRFIARQRFKILSDCTRLVEGKLRSGYAAEALELAAGGELDLVGAGDLGRLEAVQRHVRRLVGLKPLDTGVQFREREDAVYSLSISLSGTAQAAYVALDPTSILAGRIVGALRPERSGLRLDIRADGRVLVLEASEAYTDAELAASLQRIEGVREVKLRTEKLQQIDRQRPPP